MHKRSHDDHMSSPFLSVQNLMIIQHIGDVKLVRKIWSDWNHYSLVGFFSQLSSLLQGRLFNLTIDMYLDITSSPPVTFVRALEGKPIAASQSPLLKIPSEILDMIIKYVSVEPEVLASLALVNSDCRQLARIYQFRTVKFDASSRSEIKLNILAREMSERQHHGDSRFKPTLSVCIHRVVFNYVGYWNEMNAIRPRGRRGFLDEMRRDDYDDDEMYKWQQWRGAMDQSNHRLRNVYEPTLFSVMASLVHLQSLDLNQARWNQPFFDWLSNSKIRHLKIDDLEMPARDHVTDEDSVVVPLESLNIRLSWKFSFTINYEGPLLNASGCWNIVLRMSSASVKILILSHQTAASQSRQDPEVDISFSLQFPQLRVLDLRRATKFDQSALRSLILTSPRLSVLVINYSHQFTRELLDREGRISSLVTLVLCRCLDVIPDDSTLDFLKKNPQLTAFAFRDPAPVKVLNHSLSILTGFPQLRKLSLVWDDYNIPESSLTALTFLSSLEILHLSCGLQTDWLYDWYLHHESIIDCLKPLKRLKQLAFTRDIYSYTGTPSHFKREGTYRKLREYYWDEHCLSMDAWALTYAKAFPNLEFIHLGQASFEISRVDNEIKLSWMEEEDFSWMGVMFGLNRYYQPWHWMKYFLCMWVDEHVIFIFMTWLILKCRSTHYVQDIISIKKTPPFKTWCICLHSNLHQNISFNIWSPKTQLPVKSQDHLFRSLSLSLQKNLFIRNKIHPSEPHLLYLQADVFGRT